MFKNMLLVTLRTLVKQRFYTVLNLVGLGLGLSVFFAISLIINQQLSYDEYHTKADRIYRIDQSFIWGDAYPTFGSTGPGVAASLQTNVPGIEHVARIYTIGNKLISIPENSTFEVQEESNILAVDSSFLSIFSFPMVQGDPATALLDPNSIVITASTAKRYFGEDQAYGKTLLLNDGQNEGLFKVTGIVQDVPSNSHFTFDFLTSMTSHPEVERRKRTWFWSGFVTYVLLKENAIPTEVEKVIYDMPEQYAGGAYETVTSSGKEWHLFLLPITNIWLHTSDSPNRLGGTGNILYIYILAAIGLLVLVLAIVNYINLATAKAMKRNKEVGIRKVLGALNRQLVSQFMTESFALVFLAALFALLAIELTSPSISAFTGFELSLAALFQNYVYIFYFGVLITLVALLAGIYPSIFMTRFTSGATIRKASLSGQKGKPLRNVLVVFQFTISIILVVLSLVLQDQLSYLQSKDLGFDKNNLIVLPQVQRLDSTSRASLNASLMAHPSVQSTGLSSSVPPYVWDGDSFTSSEEADRNVPISYMHISNDYLATLGVEVIHGRAYRETDAPENIVLNESAVVAMGWAPDQTALGKKIVYQDTRLQIVGILKDFNYRSLDGPIEPLIMFQNGAPVFHNGASNISIRLNKSANNVANAQEFLTFLETRWDEYAPNIPFDYQFTDQSYFQAFEFEQRLGTIFTLFTALALIIACIGLLGLVSYVAEVRTKEIGIRKVLGATVTQILLLMGRDFTILIIISSIIATPIAWWAANQWLQNYEYQTTISSLVFIYAIAGSLILALITVSYQAIKSAMANPTDVLHDE